MNSLRDGLETYLALRRGLGTELRGPRARLHHFVEFLEREGVGVITAELALRWATSPSGVSSATWAQRLGDVRRFATWLSAEDPRTEVPSPALLPERWWRRPPYIYSDTEVAHILREAARLPSPLGLRAQTYETLFGLLATTGLRLGEALGLDRDDVDLRSGILAVRRAKLGKSRFVPVHDSTCRALRRYVDSGTFSFHALPHQPFSSPSTAPASRTRLPNTPLWSSLGSLVSANQQAVAAAATGRGSMTCATGSP